MHKPVIVAKNTTVPKTNAAATQRLEIKMKATKPLRVNEKVRRLVGDIRRHLKHLQI